jgi:hypothetical protein
VPGVHGKIRNSLDTRDKREYSEAMNDITLPLEEQVNILTKFGDVNVFVTETGYLCVTIDGINEFTDLNVWVENKKVSGS